MVLILLGISMLVYMAITNTIYSALVVVCLFVLPLSLYYDFTREETLKEVFLRKKNNKKVLKKRENRCEIILYYADRGRIRRIYDRRF